MPLLGSGSHIDKWKKRFSHENNGTRSMYNYKNYEEFGWIAEQVLFHVADIWDVGALYSRPDAHVGSSLLSPWPKDCLHWCQGTLNNFLSKSFLKMLMNE